MKPITDRPRAVAGTTAKKKKEDFLYETIDAHREQNADFKTDSPL